MPLQLTAFPIKVGAAHASFHDGFNDQRRGGSHQAVDIGGPIGLSVVSTTGGVVIRKWRTHSDRHTVRPGGTSVPVGRGGRWVIVLDSQNFVHYYAHLLEPRVTVGQRVLAGMLLGLLGDSGAAHRHPRLHYQVWNASNRTEPERTSGTFTGPLGSAVNPYAELVRVSCMTAGASGGVIFNPRPAASHRPAHPHSHP